MMDALDPELLTFSTGKYIGNYRLVKWLGSGAFADIYLGEHYYLKTRAAVKISRKRLTEEQRERFLKEAQIAARLVHPLVIRILEFNIEHHTPYLVMDYAEQGSLRRRHPIGERLGREDILRYAWDIAEALEYIHGQNFIHRDLKPENLLIGPDERILVSDFGIAIGVQETRGTKELESIGTLPYMAPEQIVGRPQISSDQYALGVIIYEWISGELPFDDEDQDIAWQHLHEQPPALRMRVPDLPGEVERVVLKALKKNPAERFTSIVEFVERLDEAWTPEQPGRPGAFYAQTTYNTTAALEAEALKQSGSGKKRAVKEKKRPQKTWKSVASVFLLDLLLSITARLAIPGSGWSPLWVAIAASITGLPICLGLVLKDTRTVTMGVLAGCLELLCVLTLGSPFALIGASITATSLCMLIALAAYLRFLN